MGLVKIGKLLKFMQKISFYPAQVPFNPKSNLLEGILLKLPFN